MVFSEIYQGWQCASLSGQFCRTIPSTKVEPLTGVGPYSDRARCSLLQTNSWTRLYRRRSIVLPRIYRTGAAGLRCSGDGRRQRVEGEEGTCCSTSSFRAPQPNTYKGRTPFHHWRYTPTVYARRRNSPPTMKMPSYQSPHSSTSQPVTAELVPQACASVGIWLTGVRWIRGLPLQCVTFRRIYTVIALEKV